MFAQVAITDSVEIKNYLNQQLTGDKNINTGFKYQNLYYIDSWCMGDVVFSTGDFIKQIPLRYDCLNNQLVWLNVKVGQVKLDNQNISEFSLYDAGLSYRFRKTKINNSDVYCELLFENKIKLFAQRKIIIGSTVYELDAIYLCYKRIPVYIFEIKGKTYFCKKPKIKSLIETFPQAKEQIKQLIKQKHLKCKSENDFIEIIKNCEEILNNIV